MSAINATNQIDTLLKTANTEAADALQEIANGVASKDEKKAAKRALYLLGQKGVTPSGKAASISTVPSAGALQETLQFFMSNLDGAGNQMLCFILSDPDGGKPTLTTMISADGVGIKDFLSGKLSRPEINAQLAAISGNNGARLAEMDADYGRWLVAQAREINRKKFKPTPLGFMELLPRIGEPLKQYDALPLEGLPSAEVVLADESYPRDAAALFAQPGFEAWFLDMGVILPELAQWMKTLAEKNDDGPDEIKGRRETLLRQITENVMTPDERARYVRRLELSAVVLWKTGDETGAKQALYHAQKLQTDLASDSDFAFTLVQRTMDAAREMLLASMQEKGAEA